MGFENDYLRLLPLPCPHHCSFLWLELLEYSTVPFTIRNLREDTNHSILPTRIHHLLSIHLGSEEDAPIDSKHQEGRSTQRHDSSRTRQHLNDPHGHHSFGDRICKRILHRDDVQEYALQHQTEARVRHPESTSCSGQIPTYEHPFLRNTESGHSPFVCPAAHNEAMSPRYSSF